MDNIRWPSLEGVQPETMNVYGALQNHIAVNGISKASKHYTGAGPAGSYNLLESQPEDVRGDGNDGGREHFDRDDPESQHTETSSQAESHECADGQNTPLPYSVVKVIERLDSHRSGILDVEASVATPLKPSEFDLLVEYLYTPSECDGIVGYGGGSRGCRDSARATSGAGTCDSSGQTTSVAANDYKLGSYLLDQQITFEYYPTLCQLITTMSETRIHKDLKSSLPQYCLKIARETAEGCENDQYKAIISGLEVDDEVEVTLAYLEETDGDSSKDYVGTARSAPSGREEEEEEDHDTEDGGYGEITPEPRLPRLRPRQPQPHEEDGEQDDEQDDDQDDVGQNCVQSRGKTVDGVIQLDSSQLTDADDVQASLAPFMIFEIEFTNTKSSEGIQDLLNHFGGEIRCAVLLTVEKRSPRKVRLANPSTSYGVKINVWRHRGGVVSHDICDLVLRHDQLGKANKYSTAKLGSGDGDAENMASKIIRFHLDDFHPDLPFEVPVLIPHQAILDLVDTAAKKQGKADTRATAREARQTRLATRTIPS